MTRPEDSTQAEIRQDAAAAGDDDTTQREELELDLMEEGASPAGEDIGEETT